MREERSQWEIEDTNEADNHLSIRSEGRRGGGGGSKKKENLTES